MRGGKNYKYFMLEKQFLTVHAMIQEMNNKYDCTFRLDCEVAAEPTADVSWYINGQQATTTTHIQMSYDSTTGNVKLVIMRATVQDSGEYICHAVNKLGTVQTRTVVTITSKYHLFTKELYIFSDSQSTHRISF